MKISIEELGEMFPEDDEVCLYEKKLILDEVHEGSLVIETQEDGSEKYIHFGEEKTSEEMDKYVHLMALENLLVKMCRDGLLEVSFNDDGEPLYTSTELGREAFQQEEEGEEWKS